MKNRVFSKKSNIQTVITQRIFNRFYQSKMHFAGFGKTFQINFRLKKSVKWLSSYALLKLGRFFENGPVFKALPLIGYGV